jgi:hypothetical protein
LVLVGQEEPVNQQMLLKKETIQFLVLLLRLAVVLVEIFWAMAQIRVDQVVGLNWLAVRPLVLEPQTKVMAAVRRQQVGQRERDAEVVVALVQLETTGLQIKVAMVALVLLLLLLELQ